MNTVSKIPMTCCYSMGSFCALFCTGEVVLKSFSKSMAFPSSFDSFDAGVF